jgi:hypothetical protein
MKMESLLLCWMVFAIRYHFAPRKKQLSLLNIKKG